MRGRHTLIGTVTGCGSPIPQDPGFYCRRRDATILFPFELPESYRQDCLEVVFEVQSFHTDSLLCNGGKFLWRLLRAQDVLGYYGKEESQPWISLQSSGSHSWRTLSVISQRCYPEGTKTLSSVVIAVNELGSGSSPTHVAKLFSNEHDKKVEYNTYTHLESAPSKTTCYSPRSTKPSPHLRKSTQTHRVSSHLIMRRHT